MAFRGLLATSWLLLLVLPRAGYRRSGYDPLFPSPAISCSCQGTDCQVTLTITVSLNGWLPVKVKEKKGGVLSIQGEGQELLKVSTGGLKVKRPTRKRRVITTRRVVWNSVG